MLYCRYLTLEELNERILAFDYGYSNDKNKPSSINPQTLRAANNSLKQSGMVVQSMIIQYRLKCRTGSIRINLSHGSCF